MKKDRFNIFVSGRIEFLGKHTDYCGGRSIVCAIDRGFQIDVVPNGAEFVRITADGIKETVELKIGEVQDSKVGHWSNYPQIVIERISKNFRSKRLVGCDVSFRSNLSQASGLSSSSALIIGIFSAISKINNLPEFVEYKQNIHSKEDLASYLGCIENGRNFGDLKGEKGVGTFGGSQDQTAIICCKENYLSQFSFCPVKHEADLFLPEDYVFVVGVSGVIAEKTGDAMQKYNRLSLLAKEITDLFESSLSLAQAIEKYGFKAIMAKLNRQELKDRLTQFYVESFEIIPEVSRLISAGKIENIGDSIDKSHRNANKLLGNQTPETNFLQKNARENGAIAASAFGAGFGGSVYALVKRESAENFIEAWRATYQKKFPQHIETSEFFVTKPSQSDI
jgi:galactokinase